MSIYRTSVNHPVTTALIFVAFAILGLFSLTRLPVDNFPDVESNVIMVMSSYPGASAEDVENNLTKVLENSLNGVANLKDITSNSRENISVLTLEFEYGTDIEVATNDVRDKLSMASQTLPDGASSPTIFKFSADDMPIMIMSATANQSVSALDKILDERVATPLARVTGVGTVSVNGAPQREIHVYCDPNKLEAYGLSIASISQVIAAENRNVPSGSIDIGSDTYTLRIKKEFKDPSELENIVLGNANGGVIYLRDVARVTDGLEEKSQESYTNGVRGAQIIIQKQSGYNTVNVIRGVKKELAKLQRNLPSDIKITPVVDSSDNILRTISSLKETILITFLVVMLIVYIFLGRWKGTLIVVLSIPIALLASLMYLFATGNTLNIILRDGQHPEHHLDVRPVHRHRHGRGRRHRRPGERDDAPGAGREAQGGRRPRHRRGGYLRHRLHPHDAVRVPPADDDLRHGRHHVPPAGLDRVHHHDRVHDRRPHPRPDAVLAASHHREQERQAVPLHLRPGEPLPGCHLPRILQDPADTPG